MPSEFKKSEQETIVFHFFKALKYPFRLSISILLIICGLALQYYQYESFPGVILVLCGNLLLLIKGYDNRLKMDTFKPSVKWENISHQQVDNLLQMHNKILKWDRSALDITNVLGFVVFSIISIITLYLFVNGSYYLNKSYNIIAINIIVLIVPHWLTGIRKILTKPALIMKINFFKYTEKYFANELKNLDFNYLVQLYSDKKKQVLPENIKIKISSAHAPDDFLGLYGQININDVNGKKYPYFYVVLIAKPELGLKNKTKTYNPPKGIIKEYSVQKEVDVLVIRQHTTYTSGYYTNKQMIQKIFHEGLQLNNMLLTK